MWLLNQKPLLTEQGLDRPGSAGKLCRPRASAYHKLIIKAEVLYQHADVRV